MGSEGNHGVLEVITESGGNHEVSGVTMGSSGNYPLPIYINRDPMHARMNGYRNKSIINDHHAFKNEL